MQNLTEKQIREILKEVPLPPGKGKTAITIAHKHIKDRLREVLSKIKLCTNEEAFLEFKQTIIASVYTTFIEAASPAGVTAGVSIGAPATQLTLNTFHFAGATSGTDMAFLMIRDFLTGSHLIREPEMYVFFKKPGTGSDMHDVVHTGDFNYIMSLRPQFEQTMVKDIVLDSQILTKDQIGMTDLLRLISLHTKLRPERFASLPITSITSVLMINLNTYRMYTHKITMNMVAEAIEGPHPPDSVTCIWESQFSGKMYVIIDETKDYELGILNTEIATITFLRKLVTDFWKWKISGLEGITAIEPRVIDILKGIKTVRSKNGIHKVYTSNFKTRWENVSLGDIHSVFKTAGFEVGNLGPKNKENLYILVRYPGDLMDELRRRIEAAKNADPKSPDQENLLKSLTYHYMKTSGINIDELIWREDIDIYRLIHNNTHSIQDMLGIDAARTFLILRFRQMLRDFSAYINDRHISIVFDMLTNLGIINSLSFTGVNRRKLGPLTMASYERALDVTMSSAIFGTREEIVGVSPAIYVGQRSKRIGTGSIAIEEEITPIPTDMPSMPTVDDDNILDDALIDTTVLEGSFLADLTAEEEIRQEHEMLVTGGVDKKRITTKTTIIDTPTIVNDTLPVPGAKVILPSETLIRALKKVTTDTDLVIEPIIPRETKPDDITVEPLLDIITDIGATEHRLTGEIDQAIVLDPVITVNQIVSVDDIRSPPSEKATTGSPAQLIKSPDEVVISNKVTISEGKLTVPSQTQGEATISPGSFVTWRQEPVGTKTKAIKKLATLIGIGQFLSIINRVPQIKIKK